MQFKSQSRPFADGHGKCINIQLPDLSTDFVRKIHPYLLNQEWRKRTAFETLTRVCCSRTLPIKSPVEKIWTTIEISETRAMSRGSRNWIIAATEL